MDAIPRNALLFDPSSSSEVQHRQNEVEEDDFYEVTAEDFRKIVKGLQDERKSQNPLLPVELLKERDRQLKQMAYKHSILRFRLHSGHILQAQFLSTEPISALFTFVHQTISPTLRFELRQIPTTDGQLRAENSAISLLDANIAPTSVLILKIVASDNSAQPLDELNADQIFVSGSYRSCTPSEAQSEAKKWLSANKKYRPASQTILDMLPSPDN